MVGKKLLNLVGLLFAGSQLISIAKAAGCTYGSSPELNANSDCAASSFILNNDTTALIEDGTASGCTDDSKCVLITCTVGENTCTKSSSVGYAKFGTKLFKCDNGDCVLISSPALGYYVNVDHESATKPLIVKKSDGLDLVVAESAIENIDSCAAQNAGDLINQTTPKFCSVANDDSTENVVNISDATENYKLITIADADTEPFNKDGSANTQILLKFGNGAVVQVTDNGVYVDADDSTNVIRCTNDDGTCVNVATSGTECGSDYGFVKPNSGDYNGQRCFCVTGESGGEVPIIPEDDATKYYYVNIPNDKTDPITGVTGTATAKLVKVVNGVATDDSSENLDNDINYLVFDFTGSKATTKGKGAILSGNDLSVVEDIADDQNDLCVDKEGAIWDRKDALCSARSDCVSYYSCTAGTECVVSETNTKPCSSECVVTISGGDMTINEFCNDGYYIGNGDDLVTDASVEGILYRCDNGSCSKVEDLLGYKTFGYFTPLKENTNTYAKCYLQSTNTVKCKSIAASGACSAATNAGELFSSNQFCTYDTAAKPITDAGTFFVSSAEVESTSGKTIFDLPAVADHFVAVKRDAEGSVYVVKENVRYRYTDGKAGDTIAKYKIFSRTEAQAKTGTNEICDTSNGLRKEYILDQWTSDLKTGDKENVDYYVVESS